jgi:hypothetical protein
MAPSNRNNLLFMGAFDSSSSSEASSSNTTLPAQPSAADDVFAPTEFDRVFLRLETEFAKLATDKAELQASKVEQDAKVAGDEVKLGRLREGLSTQTRHLHGVNQAIQADKALLAGEFAKVQREREVAAAQYAAAAKVQDENEAMKDVLVELARKLEVREKSVQEKEKALSSSSPLSTATIKRTRELPSRGLAANFPLTIEQDTLPGLHSGVPTVATQTTPRMPSTGSHTLRRSSTVVRRVSYNNLALWEQEGLAAHRDAAEESITGDSSVKQAYEETVDAAQLCELRHTSSERRDVQRGRSIRRVSGTLSVRDAALRLD